MGIYIVDITLPVNIEADSKGEAKFIAEKIAKELLSRFPSQDPGGSGRRCAMVSDIEYEEYGEMEWDEDEDGPFFE